MKNKNFFVSAFMFVLLLAVLKAYAVSAGTIYMNNYMDTGSVQEVDFIGEYDYSYFAYREKVWNMSYDDTQFSILLSQNSSVDEPFTIFNLDTPFQGYNLNVSTDVYSHDYVTEYPDIFYGSFQEFNGTFIEGETYFAKSCFYLKFYSAQPFVYIINGYMNSSGELSGLGDTENLTINSSAMIILPQIYQENFSYLGTLFGNTTRQYFCFEHYMVMTENVSSLPIFSFVSCLNCDYAHKLGIGVDDNSSFFNASFMMNSSEEVSVMENVPWNWMFRGYFFKYTNFTRYDDIMHWRTPFYLDVYLYKENQSDTSTAQPYTDDFSYIYVRDSAGSTTTGSYNLATSLDNMFSWMPFYVSTHTAPLDLTESFWCSYTAGHCQIKMYNNGTYDLYVMKNKIKPSINYWQYEFYKPQNTEHTFDTRLVQNLVIPKAESGSIKIYASLWEVNKAQVFWNAFYYIIVIGLWLAMVIAIFCFAPQYAAQAIIGFSVGYIIILKIIGWLWL
jgi:hypothetical protein